MFYQPCLLRIQRSQQEEEAEAEGGAEEEEVSQDTLLKWTSMPPSTDPLAVTPLDPTHTPFLVLIFSYG